MKQWKLAALTTALPLAVAAPLSSTAAAVGQAAVAEAQAVEFLTGGSRIGVSVRELEEADAKLAAGTTGVAVESVTPDSPAEKAGIQKGDILTDFDGERVRSVRQLIRLVQETPAGRAVQATILREGQRTTVTVTPRARDRVRFDNPEEFAELGRELRARIMPRIPVAPAPPHPPSGWNFEELIGRTTRLGVSVGPLSPQLAEYFGTTHGVLVTTVRENSAAAKAGLKAGDVIIAINGENVNQPADLRRRVQNLTGGEEIAIDVMRDRKRLTLKGKAEGSEPRERRRTGGVVL